MNYERIFNNFIDKVVMEGAYATREELIMATKKMLDIIKNNKDATPEEFVELVIDDNISMLEDIRKNYPVPGYTTGIKVGNINVKLFGGNIDSFERKMPDNALFDVASITKFYTQIIAYNLIKEGLFSFNTKIKDLDDRFINVGDLTINDVLTFTTHFQTNGRINDRFNVKDALDCLYGVNVVEVGKYNYNDIGMMIIKELMERVTGLSYKALVSKYITDKLNLKETFLVVPENKLHLVTGTPNAHKGGINDSNAEALGGYSGHAGIITSNDDLIKLGEEVTNGNVIPNELLKNAYTEGAKAARGVMGNTYTAHKEGTSMGYVSTLENKRSFALQGSTRTTLTIGPHSTSTVLLNPASMSIEKALEAEAKINEQRSLKGLAPLSLVKHFNFDRDGKIEKFSLIDVRQMVPSVRTLEPMCDQNAVLILRLRFLNEVIREYDKNYSKEIIVKKSI